jgi:hypothetical protein
MNSTFAVRLHLETPEPRSVPSGGCSAAVAAHAAPASHEAEARHDHDDQNHCAPPAVEHAKQALKGWMAGQVRVEQTTPPLPDVAPKEKLDGTAKLAGLGRVTVEGYVQGTGFEKEGQASGVITLTKIGDPKSTITLELHGPTQPGSAPLPTQWTATIIDKTGAFSHIKGSTTITLTLTMDPANPGQGTFHGYA